MALSILIFGPKTMKRENLIKTRCLHIVCILVLTLNVHAQVGVGTTTPDESSILDIVSTDKGLLVPRLSNAQRDAILSPAKGLLIYNSDADEFQFNSNSPSTPIWVAFSLTPTTTSSPGQSVKYSNSDTTTNINDTAGINLPIVSTLGWNDNPSLYNVDTVNHTITIGETGRYRIMVNASIVRTSGTARTAPEIRLAVNGTEIASYASTAYARNNSGHNETSLHLNEVIEVSANDVISINVVRSASNGVVNLRSEGSSNIYIEKIL